MPSSWLVSTNGEASTLRGELALASYVKSIYINWLAWLAGLSGGVKIVWGNSTFPNKYKNSAYNAPIDFGFCNLSNMQAEVVYSG